MKSSYLFSLAIFFAFFLTWQTSFAQNDDSENVEVNLEDTVSTKEDAPDEDSTQKEVTLEEQISMKTDVPGDGTILTPLKQMQSGVSAKDVVCKEGLELIFKAGDGSAACVMPSTVSKLIERGWTA